MAADVIQLVEISKRYSSGASGVQALNGINFNVGAGEFVAVMGPSGSGKSTLMNIIGLLDHADDGHYILGEVDVSGMTDDERSRLRNLSIGFVFQNFNLLPRASALRNVMLPLGYRRLSDGIRRELATSALEAVGLTRRMHHRPNQLSGGECQRVAIARALVTEPALILADEPTGNLDTRTGREIIAILKDLAARGKTILMVTHDPEVAAISDRIVTMRDGRIESSGYERGSHYAHN